MSSTIGHLYRKHIQPLRQEERRELLALITQDLTVEPQPKKRSLRELRGLGKEIWKDLDAQEYVNRLRSEWERPVS
jgi:hypothetical protein